MDNKVSCITLVYIKLHHAIFSAAVLHYGEQILREKKAWVACFVSIHFGC